MSILDLVKNQKLLEFKEELDKKFASRISELKEKKKKELAKTLLEYDVPCYQPNYVNELPPGHNDVLAIHPIDVIEDPDDNEDDYDAYQARFDDYRDEIDAIEKEYGNEIDTELSDLFDNIDFVRMTDKQLRNWLSQNSMASPKMIKKANDEIKRRKKPGMLEGVNEDVMDMLSKISKSSSVTSWKLKNGQTVDLDKTDAKIFLDTIKKMSDDKKTKFIDMMTKNLNSFMIAYNTAYK